MKINILIPSSNSLNTNNDGNNVQGDELVARLWAKNLSKDSRVSLAEINGSKENYDVSISFTPLVSSTGGYKILYMQNSFPPPHWAGTAEVFRQVRQNYDQFIFPSDGAKKACSGPENSLVCQFATDLDLFFPKEYSKNLDFNLCFVGNKIRSDRTNEQYMMCVKDKGLAIFGNPMGWQSEYCKGKISISDEAVLYSSSKICLNAHLQEHLDYGTFNFRIFNILACGGFIISDHSEFLEKEFGDCIEFTDGYWDLKNKVEHYLNNPEDRLKFKEAGIKKIKEKHTFEHRTNDLLNWLGDKI
jgi:hypothetical protein